MVEVFYIGLAFSAGTMFGAGIMAIVMINRQKGPGI